MMDADPQSRPPPQSPDAAEAPATEAPAADAPGADPPTAAPAEPSLGSIPDYLGELKSYATYWLAAKIDLLRLRIKRAIIYAILAVIGLIAAIALIVTAAVLLLVGLAGLIGNALGHRAWAGDLIVSLLVLGGIVIGVYAGVNWFLGVSRKATEQKYENKRNQQRSEHGRDVNQRARETQ
jgi:hypothetical protein